VLTEGVGRTGRPWQVNGDEVRWRRTTLNMGRGRCSDTPGFWIHQEGPRGLCEGAAGVKSDCSPPVARNHGGGQTTYYGGVRHDSGEAGVVIEANGFGELPGCTADLLWWIAGAETQWCRVAAAEQGALLRRRETGVMLRCCGGGGVARWVRRGPWGCQIKEDVQGFGCACHERKAGKDRGDDRHNAGKADRATSWHDPSAGWSF
jgi:hypothetical protein